MPAVNHVVVPRMLDPLAAWRTWR